MWTGSGSRGGGGLDVATRLGVGILDGTGGLSGVGDGVPKGLVESGVPGGVV